MSVWSTKLQRRRWQRRRLRKRRLELTAIRKGDVTFPVELPDGIVTDEAALESENVGVPTAATRFATLGVPRPVERSKPAPAA